MLVLKQNTPNSVPTPPAGKGTIFLTDNDDVAVKTNDGNVTTFPTVGGSNTQVFFNDDGAIGASANITFNKATNVLTVTGNVAATNVLTDNLKYANGANWDLQQPGGSNTQLQFNDEDQFGGSANLTFNKSGNTLTLLGTANITDVNTTGNVLVGGNLTVNGNVTYINVDTLNVEDPIISLGGGPNGTPLTSDDGKDRGTALQYFSGTAKTGFMGWDNSNAEFGMGAVTTITNDVVTFSTYGNLRVGNIIGNGQALTGLTGGNVTGQVANALVAGTVYTNAQPNITSVGTLTSLDVTGNATAGNLTGANVVSANFLTGTLTTAAQPNITSVGKLVSVLIGSTASAADFPNAIAISSQDNTGITGNENIGLVGEGVGNGVESIGVLGAARANGTQKATGLQGTATVTNSADTGAAVGVRGYSTATHSGGYNIGVLGNALGSGVGNYAFYVQNGGIASIENATYWDLIDNTAAAIAFNSAGKANILAISTVDGSETVNMSGKLNVTGNANVGNLGATHVVVTGNVTGNLLPSANVTYDLGSPTQQWRDLYLSGNTLNIGGQAVTATATGISLTGLLSGNGGGLNNLNASNLASGTVDPARLSGTYTITVTGSANTVRDAAQANITSVGTLTGLSVNGNITAANITANTGVFTGNGAGLTNINGANVTGQSANALVAGTVYTNAQPNITSVGTLTSLAVTGNTTSGNISATGDVSGATLTGSLTTATQSNITSVGTLTGLSVNGNITAANITANTGVFTGNGSGLTQLAGGNVTGQVGNALVAGTVYTAAQPNITSVGTLTSVSVTGNATAGNVYANSGTIGATNLTGTLTTAAQPNITSVGTLSSLSVTGNVAAGNLTTTGVLSVTGTGVSSIAGNLDMTSNNIINLATPVNSSDAATKQYVDDVAQGLNIHDSVAAATSGTLATATGGTITYNNGSSGVGATLTTTGSYTTIDGVNVATVGTRILVKNEANAAHNGIYTYTSSTVITRATDFNTVPEVEAGDFVFVTGGTLYDNTGWVQTDTVATIGTDSINFTQFSGAGTYNAGTGLTLTGTTFSVNASQTQVTALGTVTSGTWNSLVGSSATFAAGLSGANLASITGANVSGQVGNALVAGTVYTASQPNITSVGTLTSLGVSGAVTASTLVSNVATGTAPFTVTSTTQVANLNVATAGTAGTVTTASQPNITSVGTLSSLGVNGTVTAVAFTANTGVFTGNANGISSVQAGNIVGTTLGSSVVTSSLTTVGTVTSGTWNSLVGSSATFAAGLSGANLASITGGNVVGTINSTTLGNSTLYVGTTAIALNRGSASQSLTGITSIDGYAATVSGAAQANITSVGTLTSLNVSGNITAPNLIANTGFVISSINAAVSAAGTVQANATALTREINVTSTVASGAGVVLPTAVAGMRVTIINTAANACLVYPATGGAINAIATNGSYSLPAGGRLEFVATTTTQWYTMGAAYT